MRVLDLSYPTCEARHQYSSCPANGFTYMGTIARPPSVEADCWCFKCLSLSRRDSRETSRSVDGILRGEVARNGVWNVDAQDACRSSDHANILEN